MNALKPSLEFYFLSMSIKSGDYRYAYSFNFVLLLWYRCYSYILFICFWTIMFHLFCCYADHSLWSVFFTAPTISLMSSLDMHHLVFVWSSKLLDRDGMENLLMPQKLFWLEFSLCYARISCYFCLFFFFFFSFFQRASISPQI